VDDEAGLTAAIIGYATQYGRYGYRRITALLRRDGWMVNYKRVEWIWRQEGLKVPQKQPKRGRLWLTEGSCIRLRPGWPNHVWSYDFMSARTHDGRAFRILTIIAEYTRECLALEVARRLDGDAALHQLTELFVGRRPPDYIRSDNGPEFTTKAVRSGSGQMAFHLALVALGRAKLSPKLVHTFRRGWARQTDMAGRGKIG
jgi:transposase InsO family protein